MIYVVIMALYKHRHKGKYTIRTLGSVKLNINAERIKAVLAAIAMKACLFLLGFLISRMLAINRGRSTII